MKILVVEDVDSTRTMARGILDKLGHIVELAHHGPHALRLLYTGTYDVMITDINMPMMSGWQLIDIIQNDQIMGLHSGMEMVVTTNLELDVKGEVPIQAEFHDVITLTKPFTVDKFRAVLYEIQLSRKPLQLI
jgi:Response regulator containing CheY-like receiver, AAA-type ATPase, and DNA-binding domains